MTHFVHASHRVIVAQREDAGVLLVGFVRLKHQLWRERLEDGLFLSNSGAPPVGHICQAVALKDLGTWAPVSCSRTTVLRGDQVAWSLLQ